MKQKNFSRADIKPLRKMEKMCADCGRIMKIVLYADRSYRGGHYLGKIPLHSKMELRRVIEGGTHPGRIGTHTFRVLNKEPKPYRYAEYWECSRCYANDRK